MVANTQRSNSKWPSAAGGGYGGQPFRSNPAGMRKEKVDSQLLPDGRSFTKSPEVGNPCPTLWPQGNDIVPTGNQQSGFLT